MQRCSLTERLFALVVQLQRAGLVEHVGTFALFIDQLQRGGLIEGGGSFLWVFRG